VSLWVNPELNKRFLPFLDIGEFQENQQSNYNEKCRDRTYQSHTHLTDRVRSLFGDDRPDR
jgi:hypothetical protein